MNNLYEIPKKLKTKTGILGTIELIDAGCSAIMGVIGFALALMTQSLFGAISLVILVAAAYFIFIYKDKFDENYRVKFLRMKDFSTRQKLYYYYRGTK